MNLIDTGPLIAIIDKGQGEIHTRSIKPCRSPAMLFPFRDRPGRAIADLVVRSR